MAQSANHEATQYFQRALDLVATLPESPARAGVELGTRLPQSIALIATQGYAAPSVGAILQRARELCDQLGDVTQLFPVIWGLGAFHAVRADLGTSLELSMRALAIAERENDAALLVPARLLHGGNLLWRGDVLAAREQFDLGLSRYVPEEHAPLAAAYSYDPGTAMRAYLGMTLCFLGHPDQATRSARAAVEQTRALGHAHSHVHSLIRACEVSLLRGEGAAALQDLEVILDVSEKKGFPMWHAAGVFFRGHALFLEGQVKRGIGDMREGARMTLDTGARVMYPEYAAALADALGHDGQIEEALETIERGLEMATATTACLYEAELYRIRGELTLMASQTPASIERAEQAMREAIAIARRDGARWWELGAAISLARLLRGQGRIAEARELLSGVCGWFEEGAGSPRLLAARSMLDELTR